MRRLNSWTKTLAACAVAVSMSVTMATGAKAEETVVFAGWGGDWQKAERTHFFESFEKETGVRVIDLPDLNLSKIKAMVDTKNVEWDVVQALGMWVADEASAGAIFEKLDYSKINTAGVPKAIQTPYGVGVATFGLVLAYNTDAFKGKPHPTKWTDMWDFDKFPGKRGMLNQPRYSLEIGMMGGGTAHDDVYPLDVDKSLAKWDEIKSKVLWWDQWPQSISLLASGEMAMSLSSQGRVLSLLKKEPDAPIAMVWDSGIMTTDFLAIPKGSAKKANAQKLIAWMLDPKRQAEYAKETGVGPSNVKAFDNLDDNTKETLPSYHFDKGQLVAFDNAWWSVHLKEMTEKWNTWKLQ